MSKGLPRSLGQADAAKHAVVTRRVNVDNVVVAVSATGAAVGFGTGVIGDFPEGNILFMGAVAYLAFAGSGSDANLSDTWSGDYSVGTTATADVTLSGTEVDIVASTAIGAATSEVIAATRGVTGSDATDGGLLAPLILDNTDGSLEINLNLLIDAADITDDQSVNITVSGEVYLAYAVLGDD